MDTTSQLFTQVLSLPPAERALLAEKIWDSLAHEGEFADEDEAGVFVDDQLAKEIVRRAENHRLGRAKTVDFETFKASLREAAKGRAP